MNFRLRVPTRLVILNRTLAKLESFKLVKTKRKIFSFRLWDVETGKMLNRIDTKSAVRTCNFSYSANQVAFSTDKQMGQLCTITIVDTRDFNSGKI